MTASRIRPKPTKPPAERGRRDAIVAAAVASVVEDGYARTTMSHVARRAGVPRPLVQYYFPTLELLLRAAIEAISDDWRARYLDPDRPAGTEGTIGVAEGVDQLWAHMQAPSFRAYQELLFAARTDTALARIMSELHGTGLSRRREAAARAYAAYAAADADAFADTAEFTAIFLEGLLMHRFGGGDATTATGRQLALLKTMLAAYWASHGVADGGATAAAAPPAAVAPDLADLARALIERLEPLAQRK